MIRKLIEARKTLTEIGMTIKATDHADYRVNFRGGREATAYYTDDLDDAVATARDMASRVARNTSETHPG